MTSLAIEVLGRGPDLVFLHGWGMNRTVFRPAVDTLADDHTLHLVDLPGFGGSPVIDPYTLDAVVSELERAYTGRKLAVCGWSLGSQVAMAWALRPGACIGRLVLVGSTPCFIRRNDWMHGLPAEVFEDFASDLARDYRGTLNHFLSLQARGDEAAKSVLASLRARMNAVDNPDASALRAGVRLLLDTDLRTEIPRIRIPVLILHGGRDTLCPIAAAEWMADAVPDAKLEVFPRAGHAPFLSAPGAFIRLVRDFMHG